jgi:hypothetical protein
MIEAGLAIVLATDFNPGSSPSPSIPFVLSLASTQMHMSPAGVQQHECRTSLGRGSKIGTLESSNADFVIRRGIIVRSPALQASISVECASTGAGVAGASADCRKGTRAH